MTIFEIRITDVTAKSYRCGLTDQNLQKGENLNKRKQLQTCLEARQNVTPLIFSTEGSMGKETHVAVKRLTALLSNNWDREYEEKCGYVRARLSLSLTR